MTGFLRASYLLIRPLYERTSLHRRVIEEVIDPRLQQAYEYCRALTRHHSRTFYLATRFLPRDSQRSVFAIYSLCRYLDHLVDEAEDLVAREKLSEAAVEQRLDRFEKELLEVYEGRLHDNPVLIAWSDVLSRYPIPVRLPLELMKGIRMDLQKCRYETFKELYHYSYRVASVVGLMMCEVFGYKDDRALDHAVELGIAMQLTNILRDIGQDLSMGRIYLPLCELEIFGMKEEQIFSGTVNEPFVDLMKFQIHRARKYYRSAEKGIPMLEKKSRLPVFLAKENYQRILDKIEQENYCVYDQRVFLNTSEKLSILPGLLWKTRILQNL